MTQPHHPRSSSQPDTGRGSDICDLCAAVIPSGAEQSATVRDSSAVDPCGASQDGERQLIACGPEHLDELIGSYSVRPYDEEELWAYLLLRADRQATHERPDIDELSSMTGLDVEQVMRAQRWLSIWMYWLPERADR